MCDRSMEESGVDSLRQELADLRQRCATLEVQVGAPVFIILSYFSEYMSTSIIALCRSSVGEGGCRNVAHFIVFSR